MLNKEQAAGIIKKVTSMAKHYAVADVCAKDEGTTRFANSEINQNVSVSDGTVSVTLYDGKREASCSTNVLTDEGLEKLVRDAEAILPFVPEGEFEAFEFSTEDIPHVESQWPLTAMFGVKERAEYIKEGVALLEAGSTTAGALALTRSAYAVGNSNGAFRYAESEYLEFNTVVTYEAERSGEAFGAAGGGQICAHTPGGIDIKRQFINARNTAKAARNPVQADIGAYTVVLSPLAFSDLMFYVGWMHNAKYAEDGLSYTIGKTNQQVFGPNITIRDDVNAAGTRKIPFDFQGNRRKPVTLVENGVVRSLLYDNKTAARQKTVPTGHAADVSGDSGYPMNFVIEGGGATLDEMIAGVEKGIYINEFHYSNAVNYRNLQITGLTRNGTFLIENGHLGPAITTMRFTQSLMDALNAVTALSTDLTQVPWYNCVCLAPAARIEGFHFTSKQ